MTCFTLRPAHGTLFALFAALNLLSHAEAQVISRTHRVPVQSSIRPSLGVSHAPPAGIYCSCGPTNGNSDSITPAIAQLPFVEGVLVRVSWKDIEPSRNAYDFTLIERQIQLAEQYNTRIALALVQGSGTPSWLGQEGAQTVDYFFAGQSRTIAAAWDPVYQSIWSDTVAVLGAAFADEPRIALVHATNASHNGFEMQLPQGSEAAFVAAGYSDQGYIDSWKRSLDDHAAAFPNHALDVEVHPVFGRDAVAREVTAYGILRHGQRYGAFSAWWSIKNAKQTYPGMFTVISDTARSTFAGVQLVGSWNTTPERFDSDLQVYQDAFDLALANDVRYIEVWNADLLDVSLQPYLQQKNQELRR